MKPEAALTALIGTIVFMREHPERVTARAAAIDSELEAIARGKKTPPRRIAELIAELSAELFG